MPVNNVMKAISSCSLAAFLSFHAPLAIIIKSKMVPIIAFSAAFEVIFIE
jgi:hypothetical protein